MSSKPKAKKGKSTKQSKLAAKKAAEEAARLEAEEAARKRAEEEARLLEERQREEHARLTAERAEDDQDAWLESHVKRVQQETEAEKALTEWENYLACKEDIVCDELSIDKLIWQIKDNAPNLDPTRTLLEIVESFFKEQKLMEEMLRETWILEAHLSPTKSVQTLRAAMRRLLDLRDSRIETFDRAVIRSHAFESAVTDEGISENHAQDDSFVGFFCRDSKETMDVTFSDGNNLEVTLAPLDSQDEKQRVYYRLLANKLNLKTLLQLGTSEQTAESDRFVTAAELTDLKEERTQHPIEVAQKWLPVGYQYELAAYQVPEFAPTMRVRGGTIKMRAITSAKDDVFQRASVGSLAVQCRVSAEFADMMHLLHVVTFDEASQQWTKESVSNVEFHVTDDGVPTRQLRFQNWVITPSGGTERTMCRFELESNHGVAFEIIEHRVQVVEVYFIKHGEKIADTRFSDLIEREDGLSVPELVHILRQRGIDILRLPCDASCGLVNAALKTAQFDSRCYVEMARSACDLEYARASENPTRHRQQLRIAIRKPLQPHEMLLEKNEQRGFLEIICCLDNHERVKYELQIPRDQLPVEEASDKESSISRGSENNQATDQPLKEQHDTTSNAAEQDGNPWVQQLSHSSLRRCCIESKLVDHEQPKETSARYVETVRQVLCCTQPAVFEFRKVIAASEHIHATTTTPK
ncbi:MAG: hypothetical protein MHM6MM_003003 [Cercozoa sp. M6MM]